MSLVRINWKPDKKERRKFGVAMLLGFGLISAGLYLKQHTEAAIGCLGFGLLSGVLGLTGTSFVLPIYWLWMAVAFVMGNIISRLILAIFYYLIMTPIAFAMKLRGRDRLGLERKVDTYWVDISGGAGDYERQF